MADYTIRIRVRKRRACKLSLNNILRTFWQVFGLKKKIMFVFAVLSLKKTCSQIRNASIFSSKFDKTGKQWEIALFVHQRSF